MPVARSMGPVRSLLSTQTSSGRRVWHSLSSSDLKTVILLFLMVLLYASNGWLDGHAPTTPDALMCHLHACARTAPRMAHRMASLGCTTMGN